MEEVPGTVGDKEGWRERESQGNPCCQCNNDDIYLLIMEKSFWLLPQYYCPVQTNKTLIDPN